MNSEILLIQKDLITVLCIVVLLLFLILLAVVSWWMERYKRLKLENRELSNSLRWQEHYKGKYPAAHKIEKLLSKSELKDSVQIPEEIQLEEWERQILHSRNEMYGDGVDGHTNLGLMWTGLLQNYYGMQLPRPIPSHLVLLMMAQNKANRAALPVQVPRVDDYADLRNYTRIAWMAKSRGK